MYLEMEICIRIIPEAFSETEDYKNMHVLLKNQITREFPGTVIQKMKLNRIGGSEITSAKSTIKAVIPFIRGKSSSKFTGCQQFACNSSTNVSDLVFPSRLRITRGISCLAAGFKISRPTFPFVQNLNSFTFIYFFRRQVDLRDDNP